MKMDASLRRRGQVDWMPVQAGSEEQENTFHFGWWLPFLGRATVAEQDTLHLMLSIFLNPQP